MAVGPFERLALRLSDIEGRLGLRVGGRAWERRAEEKRPKRTAADRWIRARLGTGHRERLSRSEEDLLGWALQYHERGDIAAAQELMDHLAEHHRERMMLEGKGE